MKIDLVFPPFWGDPSVPHVAVPALTAFMKWHGHDVRQWDLNLEGIDFFVRGETLDWARARVEDLLRALATLPADARVAAAQRRLVAAAVQHEYLRRHVPGARAVFRDGEAFQDLDAVARAKEVLNGALELVGAAFHPTRVELWKYFGLEMRFDHESSAELLAATCAEEENPFLLFYRRARLVERFRARGTALLGLSICNQVQLVPALTLARLVREELPGVRIVLGGNIVTRLREGLLRAPALFALVDGWIVYEGEEPLLAFAAALERGAPLDEVPNLLYVADDGPRATAVRTGRDVERIPPPDFDDLPLSDYFSPDVTLPYQAAVGGCYWRRCTFCEITGGFSAEFRTRSVERVVADLRALRERYGARLVYFTDEAQSPERLAALARGILDSGLDVRWMAMARADVRSRGHFALLQRSGCRALMFGVESASPPVLKDMSKGTSPAGYREVLRECHGAGIWTHAFFMFDFPTERLEDAERTLRFIEENRAAIDSIGSSQFELGHLTPVRASPQRFGVEVLPTRSGADLTLSAPYAARRGKSPAESRRVMERLNELKLALTRERGLPRSFGAAIGNSVNVIAWLLSADPSCTLDGFGAWLDERAGRAAPSAAPKGEVGVEGALYLDPELSYGRWPIASAPGAAAPVIACVVFHPALEQRFGVLPAFASSLLDVIRERPRRPSEVLSALAHREGAAPEDLAPAGDLLVGLHDAGLIHVARA